MNRKQLSCIIVEDEPIAAEIIADYISEVSYLILSGKFIDALSANEYLQSNNIDVIFLDIHLPGVKGTEFLKTLQAKYQVIFTTAYKDYALEGFDLNVIDYLLKPVSLPRFMQAVNKLSTQTLNEEQTEYEIFNENKKQYKINRNEILYIESNRDYCKVHLIDKSTITTKITISEMQQRLSIKGFRRIHKSYLINESKIKMTSAQEVMLNDVLLPVGRMYK